MKTLTRHHRETASWDVRTKNVTYEIIPTLEHIRGIAIYGPGATLFTLGRSNTCQQFDVSSPSVLVANVQHPANLLPPSPPVSIEEQKKGSTPSNDGINQIPAQADMTVSESDEDHMSPLARIAREMDQLEERQQYGQMRRDTVSPASSAASSTSRSSAGPRPHYRPRPGHGSIRSAGLTETTLMSPGSSIHTHTHSVSSRDTYASSLSSSSQTSGRSRGRRSNLRQEVLRSPEEKIVVDLFKFTKSRLSDIPYAHPQVLSHKNMTHDHLRRQMLNTIFGWNGEVDDLIRDEMCRHPIKAPERLLLLKWLGDIDTDIMTASLSESMTASDWMLLALSGIGGQTSQQKVARAYVQRLLEKGDVHTAATIMIAMGDQNDAIEIYVSHKRYMEALILTCMVYPADWGRQTQLLRKWGEWAVQHSQQQLAIRCFSCTGADATEPYPTPNAQTLTFQPLASSIPEMLSPPLSPPGVVPRGPQRSLARTAALKLVTTFGDLPGKSKFFGPDDDRTPMAGVGTPIAESALSPGGGTAFHRPSDRSVFKTPVSARTATPGGFQRQRLPSIGEMPQDELTPIIKMPMITIPTPRDKTANEVIAQATAAKEAQSHHRKPSQPETHQLSAALYQGGNRAATASPMMQRAQRGANPLPSPSPDNFTQDKVQSRTRNGSRGRKPDGLQIHWPPMESIITGDYMTTPELSSTSQTSARRRPAAGSVAGSASSVSTSGRSYKSFGTAGAASPMTGKSLDPYISSLDSASYHAKKQAKAERQASRERDTYGRGRSSSKTRKAREPSPDRGRSGVRYITPAKRSPTSPVPMSPEDLRGLGAVGFGDEPFEEYKARARDGSQATARPGSKNTSRIRRMSPEPLKYPDSRPSSRMAKLGSRRTSPSRSESSKGGRGRSKGRDRSVKPLRSPSSPVALSTEQAKYARDEDDMIDLKAAQSDQERFRTRQRSTSRLREKGPSRTSSPGKKHPNRSTSRAPTGRSSTKPEDEHKRKARNRSHSRTVSDLKTGDITQMKTERQLKRENAARELEERRRSLARRPSAPPIMHPEQLSPPLSRPASRSELLRSSTYPSPRDLPTRSHTVNPEAQQSYLSPVFYGQTLSRSQSTVHSHSRNSSASNPQMGLPATPKAMQHPRYGSEGKDVPDVPQIPESYTPIHNTMGMGSLNEIAYNNAFENLAPLPQTTFQGALPRTTYQQAAKNIPRSMSAPIREQGFDRTVPNGLPAHPAFQASLPPSTRRGTADYRVSISSQSTQMTPLEEPHQFEKERNPLADYKVVNSNSVISNNSLQDNIVGMGGDPEMMNATPQQYSQEPRRNSNDNIPPPPPPPPAPPVLPQLQHLARPPPPPPAPLHRGYSGSQADTNSLISGVSLGSSSGVIEIVMDDGDDDDESHATMHPSQAQVPSQQLEHQRQVQQAQPQHCSPQLSQGVFKQQPIQYSPQMQQSMLLNQQIYQANHQSSQSLQMPPPPLPAPQPPRKSLELDRSKPPPVPLNTNLHGRGRSFGGSSSNDNSTSTSNSLSSRISRATERMRSASRGASPQLNRQKISAPVDTGNGTGHSPYESVPQNAWGQQVDANGMVLLAGMQTVGSGQRNGSFSGGVSGQTGGGLAVLGMQAERHPRDVKAAMMEGGMI